MLARVTLLHSTDDDEEDEDEDVDDEDGSVTTLTLDLPSLEKLHVEYSYNITICDFKCPKLKDVHLVECIRMAPPQHLLAQLKSITSVVSQTCMQCEC